MTYRIKPALLIAATAIAVSIGTTTATADEWNKETQVTFSGAVEVYRTVLPAGTYIFKLADSQASRNIVQIYSGDRQHLITTFLAAPAAPHKRPNSPFVMLNREKGNNPVVTTWFYQDDNYGREFPHSR